MKMERVVGEKRGGGGGNNSNRSIDISGIPQSVLDRSLPSSVSVGQLSPNGNGRLNLYHSPTSGDKQPQGLTIPAPARRAKSPGGIMTNGRSYQHQNSFNYSPTSSGSGSGTGGLPLTKNVGVGVNLTQNRGSAVNGKQGFATPQLPHGRGGQLSHSPTPPSTSTTIPGGMTNSILPELLQQGQSGRLGGKNTSSLVPNASSLVHSAKGGSLSSAQRDLFNNLNANANKIVSQNLNGTLAVTSVPTNDSELQLFRVLQRANLLNYFDVMIELGGDDVQQLCDAGEEEFLEIMALIGMASKPLHVRRLQKSLQDWMTQPNLFPGPVLGPPLSAFTGSLTAAPSQRESTTVPNPSNNSNSPQMPMPIRPIPFHSGNSSASAAAATATAVPPSAAAFLSPNELKALHMRYLAMRNSSAEQGGGNNTSSGGSSSSSPINNQHSIPLMTSTNQPVIPIPFQAHSPNLPNGSCGSSSNSSSSYPPYATNSNSNGINGPGPGARGGELRIPADQIIPSQFLETRIITRSEPNSPAGSGSSSESPQLDSRTSISPIPFLQDHEVQKIADAAIKVIQSLPDYMAEPRVSAKRKTCADFETVLRIGDDDPRRLDKVRKYAAIYGRYDCKRKVQKPLTIHELSVNEAASHLCNQVPALLTRRDELFLLARQVVRDAGLPYSSIISTTSTSGILFPQLKNPKVTTRIEDISNGSSNDSNNSFGAANAKKPRLGDCVETEEFNGQRSTPEIDRTSEDSGQNARLNSNGHLGEGTPESGRCVSIYTTESTTFSRSPRYEYESSMPDDLRINNKRTSTTHSSDNSKTYKNHEVKAEPASS